MCIPFSSYAKRFDASVPATWYPPDARLSGSELADAISYLRKLAREGTLDHDAVADEVNGLIMREAKRS